jgi:hypothetical protein
MFLKNRFYYYLQESSLVLREESITIFTGVFLRDSGLFLQENILYVFEEYISFTGKRIKLKSEFWRIYSL